jgi:UDPglucose 6-dehydrogenase
MTITFIGHGYVGLVTAAVFADLGNDVWVVGRTKEKIDRLNNGDPLIYEPGLEELLKRNLSAGRIHFTLDYKEAVDPSSVIFIAVGTPSSPTGEADLTQVFASAKEIAKYLSGYKVVVTKSTVPPGTGKKVMEIINKEKPAGSSFAIASAPEFLREGTGLSDTLHPDRIVIGTSSDRAREILTDLHKSIDSHIVHCNVETAELIKYASNSMLATKISFANSISFLSDKVGADVERVLEGVGLDKRIGRNFLYPGVGYGGSCFPKDVKALIAIAEQFGYDFKLLKAVNEINAEARTNFVEKIIHHFGDVKGKKIAILGLAFKPDTDDMRYAPSIDIVKDLIALGASVNVYDPIAMARAKLVLSSEAVFAKDSYDAVMDADAVAVITEWNEFRHIDLVRLAKGMKHLVLFDGRNIYDPASVRKLGYVYYGIGRN